MSVYSIIIISYQCYYMKRVYDAICIQSLYFATRKLYTREELNEWKTWNTIRVPWAVFLFTCLTYQEAKSTFIVCLICWVCQVT